VLDLYFTLTKNVILLAGFDTI